MAKSYFFSYKNIVFVDLYMFALADMVKDNRPYTYTSKWCTGSKFP